MPPKAKPDDPIPLTGLPASEIDAPKRVIARELARRIRAGVYPVGTKIPAISTVQTMSQPPTAKNTARAATDLLEEWGMVRKIMGMGTIVTDSEDWAAPSDAEEKR